MMQTSSIYEACHELFAAYSLAATDDGGAIRSMVLLLQNGDDVGFFVLLEDRSEGKSVYSLRPWRERVIADIDARGSTAVPEVVVNVVTQGVPVPRHGSLFGWICEGAVTALVAVYGEHTPERRQPSWAVMPLVGVEEAKWPPFTSERVFGDWFWGHYRAGTIISLGRLISETTETVFWVDTKAILGSDCCAVAHDIRNSEGYMLRRGRYVYHQSLRARASVPSLRMLLADADKADLAPRFSGSRI